MTQLLGSRISKCKFSSTFGFSDTDLIFPQTIPTLLFLLTCTVKNKKIFENRKSKQNLTLKKLMNVEGAVKFPINKT